MTTPVSGTGTNQTTPPPANNAAGGQKQLDATYNDFLKLLLVQLKNQDPTKPLDTAQFTQQIVSLSQVQQSVNTNTNLEKLISVSQGTQINNAVSYIGRTVEAKGNEGFLQNGGAEFTYSLPAGVKDVTLAISDAGGNVLFTSEGSKLTGKNVVLWDGSQTNGGTAQSGTYHLTVIAKDAAGKTMDGVTTYTTGTVTSVDMQNGVVTLALNGGADHIDMDSVTSIRLPATTGQQQAA